MLFGLTDVYQMSQVGLVQTTRTSRKDIGQSKKDTDVRDKKPIVYSTRSAVLATGDRSAHPGLPGTLGIDWSDLVCDHDRSAEFRCSGRGKRAIRRSVQVCYFLKLLSRIGRGQKAQWT